MNSLIVAKKIVEKKYNKNNPYYPMYILSLYGIIKKYKDIDLIEKVFLTTDIYIEEDSISNILKNHNINCFDYEESEEENNTIFGISTNNHNFNMTEEGDFFFQEENPFLICSIKECNPTILLNTFIHELLHLIKSNRNSFNYEQKDKDFFYSIRCGIAYYDYTYTSYDDTLSSIEYFDTIDEAINVIDTSEVINYIYEIKDLIDNKLLSNYLNSLDDKVLLKDSGYEEVVPLIRKLWQIDSFKESINNNILDGNIEDIINNFDNYTYKGAFLKLANLIDKIDFLEISNNRNKKLIRLKKEILEIIKIYKKNILVKTK